MQNNREVQNNREKTQLNTSRRANGALIAFADAPSTNIMTVFEHQRLMMHDFCHASDFHWLIAQELSVFAIVRKQGQWQLRVGHYIGVILLPSGMMIEVLPKLNQSTSVRDIRQTRQWVQGMLVDLIDSRHQSNRLPHTKNLGQFSPQLTALPIAALPLPEWLIAQFLQRLAHYQPTTHYKAQIDNQSALQGRLLIKEQLRHNRMQPHKFVCESSILSQDMLANRLIKSALVRLTPLLPKHLFLIRLQPWQRLPMLNQHEMQQLESIYSQAKQQLAIQPLQRQKRHAAQQLVDLAYWLLRSSNTAAGNGITAQHLSCQQLSPRLCLLIDMSQAFEQWASWRIASMFEQISSNYRASLQTQSVWLSDTKGQACLSIRPDLLIYDRATDAQSLDDENNTKKSSKTNASGRYSHVIDIKWKHLSHAAAISASDAYQLTSYAQAYRAGQVWLVYPVQGDERQPIALRQQYQNGNDAINRESNSSANSSNANNNNANKPNSNHSHLWLMPFNVLTGTINGGVSPDLHSR